MEILGFFLAILIGISLGLIGGGGSILTVPVLVYLFQVDVVIATTYSLFVVGITSLVGSLSYFKKGLVNLRISLYFGLPSLAGVLLARKVILPIIPDVILIIGGFEMTKSIFLMLVFAVLMLLASYKMIKKQKVEEITSGTNYNYGLVIMQGLLIGMVTGLIGAGGGFLIIPALVSLLHLPMKKAVGTSLLIIAINSVFGFSSSYNYFPIVDWQLLLSITGLSIVGIIIGSRLAKNIDGKQLKPAFGYFVLVMGILVIVKEIFLQ